MGAELRRPRNAIFSRDRSVPGTNNLLQWRFQMPVVVVVHRLKSFDEWINIFKTNPPPKVGRWRQMKEAAN
jgi:hypothetical protein